MDAPADAPKSENRAFGRPNVKRRAGLSSSSVVGLSAVSIRAMASSGLPSCYSGGAPRGAAVLSAFPEHARWRLRGLRSRWGGRPRTWRTGNTIFYAPVPKPDPKKGFWSNSLFAHRFHLRSQSPLVLSNSSRIWVHTARRVAFFSSNGAPEAPIELGPALGFSLPCASAMAERAWHGSSRPAPRAAARLVDVCRTASDTARAARRGAATAEHKKTTSGRRARTPSSSRRDRFATHR